ncbi:hypothetical protein ASPBRDRAFT_139405, partial [Aspergillus brasiliensis CBS 101740]
YIERIYLQRAKWPSIIPICGCLVLFKSKIKFYYYLHDVHGLTNVIWWKLEPKPAAKRK